MIFIEELYSYFNRYIEFPEFNIDRKIAKDYKIGVSDIYIEEVACMLRKHWGVLDGPIDNLIDLLERNGVIVTRFDLDTHNVDAFSSISNTGTPIVVLGSDKKSAVRSRLDVAHELGHLILHSRLSKEDIKNNHAIIESEANRFAGAFLLPYSEFTKDIYSVNLDSFVYLKRKWKVSVAAMIVRSHNLNIISDDQYTYLFKRLSAKKWRTCEPLDDTIEFERPKILREAIELLLENNILTKSQLIKDLAFSNREIEKLCFLPKGYLGTDGKKPVLRVIK